LCSTFSCFSFGGGGSFSGGFRSRFLGWCAGLFGGNDFFYRVFVVIGYFVELSSARSSLFWTRKPTKACLPFGFAFAFDFDEEAFLAGILEASESRSILLYQLNRDLSLNSILVIFRDYLSALVVGTIS